MFVPIALIASLVLAGSVQSQQLRRTSSETIDKRGTDLIRASLRSTFGIRPFQKSERSIETSKTTYESSTDPNNNELNYEEKPTRVWVPGGLDFSCKGRTPGYYSDPSPLSKCQVYHMCMPDGRRYSMLCGVGTIFNQITFVCDHWYNYRCKNAESDYSRNDKIFGPEDDEVESDYEEIYDDENTTEPDADLVA